MSTLRISDAPLLPDVDGTEKIPTGGRGDYAISVDQIKGHIFEDVGKELVGLGNVDNTSDLDKPVSTAQQAALDLKADKTYVDTNLDLKADKTSVYTRSETTLALSQKADLVGGVVPSDQLPSYVDDVVEYTTSTLPIVGESGKIYITTDTNRTWRWSGNQYVEISNGGVSDSTLKLQTPRKIASVDFDGTQDISIPHNNLTGRNVADAHTAISISTLSGETQQDVNDFGGAKWRNKADGYSLGATVKLDSGVIVKSTVANNTANPNVDMTGWILANDSSQIIFRRTGLSATIRTLLSKLQDVVSVMDFGAVGDGVTDDSAAINAAFNSGAGAVLFPHSTYYIAENITPKSNTVIYGCQSTIKYENETSILLIIDVARVTIYDLVVDGNYLNWTSDQAYTVGIYRSRDISILNCEIKNGVHAGIGIGQTDGDATPNERILIDNCYIHHIGTPSVAIAYGNGIAVVRGHDVVIRNNNISDIHHVGAINVEGLAHDNIQIIGNRISRTTGIAAGIKIYASGADAPANNVIIRDNILTDLSTDAAVNAEPAIWIQAGGRNVSVLNNIVDGVNSQGIFIQNATNLTLVGNTIRAFTKTPLIVNTVSESMKVSNNLITYPLGSSADPVFIETSGSLQSIADITGNTVEHAPKEAFILNARSPIRFTGNTIVNCRSNGTFGYAINYLAGVFSNCVIGDNIIKDTIASVGTRFIAFYNFSGNHPDLVYLPDAWSVTESIPKFDLGANTAFIQSSVALKSAPPTTGYNEKGRILYNADPAANAVTGWMCTVSGTPGTWKAFGQLV